MLAAIFHNFTLGRHLQFLTNIVISRKTVLTVTEIHPKTRSQEHTKEALFLPSADPSLLPPLVTSVRPEHRSDVGENELCEGACGRGVRSKHLAPNRCFRASRPPQGWLFRRNLPALASGHLGTAPVAF